MVQNEVYRRRIANWRDPFTVPNSKITCLRREWGICVEFKTEFKYLYVNLFVVVTVADVSDIQGIVENCLREAAVIAAISGILAAVTTGGAALEAAKVAFITVFKACLIRRISEGELIDVRLEQETYWGEWE